MGNSALVHAGLPNILPSVPRDLKGESPCVVTKKFTIHQEEKYICLQVGRIF